VAAASQAVAAPLTRTAIFLVLTINAGADNAALVRDVAGGLSSLVRAVGFRDTQGQLSCVLGIGSVAWDRLFGSAQRPKELHTFRQINGVHRAPSTAGDLLLHIRATRMDMCFELAAQIMARLRPAVTTEFEVHGFKYFDDRDLLGFVDGTENPVEQAAIDATIIGPEDPGFAGGSYVITQKYLHDLTRWNGTSVEDQEKMIGRYKLSDIEMDAATKPSYAHSALTQIFDGDEQLQILRDNMPFGEAGRGEFGTFFIGYARSPSRVERMLDNMFIGRPLGNYDRLLDFSRAVTGSLFFVPAASFLDAVAADGASAPTPLAVAPSEERPAKSSMQDGSLGIGSLKDEA